MPTYQYACTECREELEAVQTFTDAPLTECPTCAGRLRKVYSAVGVVFKGSGFYKNDSRAPVKESSDSGSSDSGSSDKGASDKGSSDGGKEKTSADKGSSGDKGGESKPAPKKETAPAAGGSSSTKSPSAA